MLLRTKIGASLLALSPMMALAKNFTTPKPEAYVTPLINTVANVLNALVPVIIAATILAFFWFLFNYVKAGGEGKETAKTGMIWSIIVIAIMFSIYGLVSILQTTFGVEATTKIDVPTLPGVTAS